MDLHVVKQNLTVSGFNSIENHDSELVQVSISTEECRSQKVQLAIHNNLVIGDTSYDVQRTTRQHTQLATVPAINFRLKVVKVITGTDSFPLAN